MAGSTSKARKGIAAAASPPTREPDPPLVGHEAVRAALARCIRGADAEEPAQAYLLSGPLGVGKRALALWFARLLHCQARRPTSSSSPPAEGAAHRWLEPCGQCPPCRKHRAGQHPDLVEIVGGEVEVQADGTQVVKGSSLLKVAQIREMLLPETRFGPRESRIKMVLLPEADRITGAGYEALLKALEEPVRGNVFVLAVCSAEQVTATIRSRCQLVRLGRVEADAMARWLEEQGVEPSRARQAAVIADGCPGAARSLCADSKRWAQRESFLEVAILLADGDALEVVEQGERFTERSAYAKASGEEKRLLLVRLLELLASWFRDMLLLHQGAGSGILFNVDQEPVLRRCAGLYSTPRLLAALEAIGQAQGQVARNVNPRLLLVRLFLKLAAAA